MVHLRKKVLIMSLSGILTMTLSGCFLRGVLGHQFVRTIGEEVDAFIAAFSANATTAICSQETEGNRTFVECTYFFASEEELFPEIVTTAELISDFGFFGVLVDPLILQVPDDATNFAGTFYDGSSTRALDITVTDSFAVQPGTTVTAEAGQQFVIVELPADVVATLPSGDPRLGPQFDFNLEFELANDDPLALKALFTGKVESNGQTFYLPLLPCTADFATIPSFTIPQSPTPELLLDPIINLIVQSGDMGCDNQVYDLRAGGSAAGVVIDVKPGSDPNSINPRNKGAIPVAILTTSVADGDALEFDATTVAPLSVVFGPGAAAEAHGKGHVEDVDGDGDDDLMLHFRAEEAGVQCGDTEVSLAAETFGGQAVEGFDSIDTVGC